MKILWALSFMKNDWVARFVDCTLRIYQTVGTLPYESWHAFMATFIEEFCPKNKVQTAWCDLETTTYFQGCRSVKEYVDQFHKLIAHTRYFEGEGIVLMFHRGLDSVIQDQVACMSVGQPSNDIPNEWYQVARLH